MANPLDSLFPIRRILRWVSGAWQGITYRPDLAFVGAGVVVTEDVPDADSPGGRIVCTISGGGTWLDIPAVVTDDDTPEVLGSLPIDPAGVTVYEVTIAAYDETPRAVVWGPFTLSAAIESGVAQLTSGSITTDVPEVTDTQLSTATFALDENGTNIDIVGTGFDDVITWVVRARRLI